MATNGAKDASALLSPKALCHFVLKTTPENHQRMINFYLTFLGAKVTQSNHRITFMTYDSEHHRVAIVAIPNLTRPDPPKSGIGLAHTAFGFDTLAELATSYEQKKSHGILPVWAVNHGVSVSFYYEDPDGNEVETQVDCFGSKEEAMEYIQSDTFAENPIGVDFDPEEFVRRVKSGEDAEIKRRPDIGARLTRNEKAGVFG